MNDVIATYTNEEYQKLKTFENKDNPYIGYIYILEYGDKKVKIGFSAKPYQRVMALKRNAEKYGNYKLGSIAISPAHTNYRDNEKILHKHFQEYRDGDSELFSLTLQETLSSLSKLSYNDNSAQQIKHGEAVSNFFIDFVKGKYNNQLNQLKPGEVTHLTFKK